VNREKVVFMKKKYLKAGTGQLLHSGKPNKGEPSRVELALCSGKAPLQYKAICDYY